MSKRFRYFVALGLMICLLGAPACGQQSGRNNIDPDAGGQAEFDLDLAIELGLLCLYAYQMLIDFNNGTTFTIPSEYVLVDEFNTSELFAGEGSSSLPIAYIATRGKAIYLVFRGTTTPDEWVEDAKVFQEDYPIIANGGKTEVGFTEVYVTINTAIIDKINELTDTSFFNKIYVIGHSLGSSLATLALPDVIANTDFNYPILYNFASPRVGNPTFASGTIGGTSNTRWRVANTNDLIPDLPPTTVVKVVNNRFVTFFYEHITTLKSITFGTPPELSDAANGSAIDEGSVGNIAFNHEMCNYYNALCEMTNEVDSCKAEAQGVNQCNE